MHSGHLYFKILRTIVSAPNKRASDVLSSIKAINWPQMKMRMQVIINHLLPCPASWFLQKAQGRISLFTLHSEVLNPNVKLYLLIAFLSLKAKHYEVFVRFCCCFCDPWFLPWWPCRLCSNRAMGTGHQLQQHCSSTSGCGLSRDNWYKSLWSKEFVTLKKCKIYKHVSCISGIASIGKWWLWCLQCSDCPSLWAICCRHRAVIWDWLWLD